MCPLLLSFDETLFENPYTFDPMRWQDKKLEKAKFLFGHGAHRCKGEQFALTTLKTCWYILLSEYEVELVESGVPEAVYTRYGFPEPKSGKILVRVKKIN